MGVFVIQEVGGNRLKIKWIRKPLFSGEEDFEIDLYDIKEVDLYNGTFGITPDEFYLLTYSGKSMSFYVLKMTLPNSITHYREEILNKCCPLNIS